MHYSLKKLLLGLFCGSALLLGFTLLLSPYPTGRVDVHIATEATYPPFAYWDADHITGLDIALLQEICKEEGLTYVISHYSFDALIPGLQQGAFDVVAGGLSLTLERAKQVDFSDPCYSNKTALLVLDPSILSTLVGSKQKIGMQKGNTFEYSLKQAYGDQIQIKPYESFDHALIDLAAGRIQAVVGDEAVLQWKQSSMKDTSFFLHLLPGGEEEKICFAVQKGHQKLVKKLNRGLKKLKQNGRYEAIIKEHKQPKKVVWSRFAWPICRGIGLTLVIALLSLLLGLAWSALFFRGKRSAWRWTRRLTRIGIGFLQGIPELLVLLGMYYSFQSMSINCLGRSHPFVPIIASVMTLSLLFGTYAVSLWESAFQQVPKGNQEAAYALGLSSRMVFWRITFPQALRHAFPALQNLWFILLKDTALVALVGLYDLMNTVRMAAMTTHAPLFFYSLAALAYLSITLLSRRYLQRILPCLTTSS